MPVAAMEPDGTARPAERRDGPSRTLYRPRRKGRRTFPPGLSARMPSDPFGQNRQIHRSLHFHSSRKCHPMKIASFKAGQTATYGLVTNAGIIDAGKRLNAFP